MTKTLCIHWPARHVTTAAAESLRSVIDQHPGPDVVVITCSTDTVLRIPQTVDAESCALRHDIGRLDMRQAMTHVLDSELAPL